MRQVIQGIAACLMLGSVWGCAVTEDSLMFDLTGNGSKSYGVTSVIRAGQLPPVILEPCDLDDVYTFNVQREVRFDDSQYNYQCMENGEVRQPLQGTWTLNFGTREMVIVNEDNDPGYLQGTYAIVEHDQDHFVLQGDWLGIPSQITLTRDAHWQF